MYYWSGESQTKDTEIKFSYLVAGFPEVEELQFQAKEEYRLHLEKSCEPSQHL